MGPILDALVKSQNTEMAKEKGFRNKVCKTRRLRDTVIHCSETIPRASFHQILRLVSSDVILKSYSGYS